MFGEHIQKGVMVDFVVVAIITVIAVVIVVHTQNALQQIVDRHQCLDGNLYKYTSSPRKWKCGCTASKKPSTSYLENVAQQLPVVDGLSKRSIVHFRHHTGRNVFGIVRQLHHRWRLLKRWCWPEVSVQLDLQCCASVSPNGDRRRSGHFLQRQSTDHR